MWRTIGLVVMMRVWVLSSVVQSKLKRYCGEDKMLYFEQGQQTNAMKL